MSATDTPLIGDEMLVCVLGGVFTDVERTLIELQRAPIVHETRSAFQNAMEHRFVGAIERLSGRKVLTFISDHHVGPRHRNRTIHAHTPGQSGTECRVIPVSVEGSICCPWGSGRRPPRSPWKRSTSG
jgi:Na+-translocating membrane potential-generating system (MpsC)